MKNSVFVILSLLLIVTQSQAAYLYPYTDPMLATLSGGLMRGNSDDPNIWRKHLHIQVRNDRDNVPCLEGRGHVNATYYPQTYKAPLIFVLSGIGGMGYYNFAEYYAELFQKKGFHVVTLPSTMSWNFALGASKTGIPGYLPEDTKILYNVIIKTIETLKSEYYAEIGSIYLMGGSLGAVEGAFLSDLDFYQGKVGFSKILLVNPPVSFVESLTILTNMMMIGTKLSPARINWLKEKAISIGYASASENIEDPKFFLGLKQKIGPVTDAEMGLIIASYLSSSVGDVVTTSQLIHDNGVLKAPFSCNYRQEREAEVSKFTLAHYFQMFLLPSLGEISDATAFPPDFEFKSSLLSIQDSLSANDKVLVMHNSDDFLVTADDLKSLDMVFGPRLVMYPKGGHLGNLWYPENKAAILKFFNISL